jgi:hypothetical protein
LPSQQHLPVAHLRMPGWQTLSGIPATSNDCHTPMNAMQLSYLVGGAGAVVEAAGLAVVGRHAIAFATRAWASAWLKAWLPPKA